MKNIRLMLYPLALIVLVFSLAGGVFAQNAPVYCYDLNETDCALYTDLQANTQLPTSTAFTLDVSGEISAEQEQMPFAVAVSGAYVTDVDAVEAAVDAFGEITLRDVSLGSFVTLLDDVVSAWDASLSIDLSGIPEASMLTNGETINLYLVDGVAYVNDPLLAMVLGDPSLEGVYGIDLFEVIDFGLSSVTMADLMELGEGMAMGMDDMSGEDFMQMFEEGFMEAFNQNFGMMDANAFSEEDFDGIISLERLDDEEANGETVYVFTTTLDMSELFVNPAFREQIIAAMEMQFDDDMMGMEMESLLDGLSASLEGSTMTIIQKYGATSSILVNAELVMNMIIDGGEMAAAMGETQPAESEEITMDMRFSYTLEDVNAVESIDLPADAQIVPFMDLIAGGSSM